MCLFLHGLAGPSPSVGAVVTGLVDLDHCPTGMFGVNKSMAAALVSEVNEDTIGSIVAILRLLIVKRSIFIRTA